MRTARLSVRIPSALLESIKYRCGLMKLTMTQYVEDALWLGPTFQAVGNTSKRLECPIVPRQIIRLRSGRLAYVLDRELDKVFVLMRLKRGWDPVPVEVPRSYVHALFDPDDRAIVGIRQPKPSLVERAHALVVLSPPDRFKPLRRSVEEERLASPDERLRLGLCVQCSKKLSSVEKRKGALCSGCSIP